MTVINKVTITFTASKLQPFYVVREQSNDKQVLREAFEMESLDGVLLCLQAFVGAQRTQVVD